MVKKPQLHISALNMLNRCGAQFEFRYIKNIKRPPGVAMVVGTAVDTSVNANLNSKKDTQKLLPLAEVRQAARDALDREWEGGISFDADEAAQGQGIVKGEAVDKAIKLASLHSTDVAPKIEPSHVQWGWTIELKGFPMDLAGTVDVRESKTITSIRDTKTSGKSPSSNVADVSDQLTAYAMAVKVIDGKAPELLALDYLIANKTPVAKTFTSRRDDDDFNVLLRRVENASRVIDSGAFTPMPQTDPMCSQKYCGYYDLCIYAKKPKLFQIGATSE
jgi:CRISPR/Cas system-associated exonuclease Cas4 (RecB family)